MRLADIGIKKEIKILQVCFLIALVFCSVLIAEEPNSPSLAILVYCDGGSQELADKLQPLIEAEASLQWDGTLVERAQIDKLLDEMKLTRSGLSDPNNQLQLGKMITMNCLLTVRVNKDSVKTTLSEFPSTTIIHEKEYTERLESQSLSVNIVTNAIKGYREHDRQPDKPQVSIGSFYGTGLSKKYFTFGRDVSTELRKKLVGNKTIILTERLIPSDLLNEFELARGGLTQSIAQNLSAPPSDILIYGEFRLKPKQDLNNLAAELDFMLFLIAPTGLCESKDIEFSCFNNQPEVVVKQALKLIEQATNKVKTKLASGQQRVFSEREFNKLKELAFRLMPNPPKQVYFSSSQNYGIYQDGDFNQLESALHMLECALLFKGNDVMLLTCTGAILQGMYNNTKANVSKAVQEKYLIAAREIVKRAYMIESNENTRNCYCRLFIGGSNKEALPSDYLDVAQHIWNTGKSESWSIGNVNEAMKRILGEETGTELLSQFFFDVANEYDDKIERIQLFSTLLDIAKIKLTKNKGNQELLQSLIHCSKVLMNENEDYICWIGHFLYLISYSYNGDDIPVEYAKYFHSVLSLLEQIQAKNRDLLMFQHIYFTSLFDTYNKVIQQYNLENDSTQLLEKYIKIMNKSSSFAGSASGGVFNLLLSQLWEQGDYQKGYDLLTEYLKKSDPIGDHFIKERNKFFNAMNNKSQNSIGMLQKIDVKFLPKDMIEFICLEKCIIGITNSSYIFKIDPREKKVTLIKKTLGKINGIAYVNNYIGIATAIDGFYLIRVSDMNIQHFTPDNSSFPDRVINDIRDSGNRFIITLREGNVSSESRTYLIEPETAEITKLAYGILPEIDKPQRQAKYKEIMLTNYFINTDEANFTINDINGKQLIKYSGIELGRLNDLEIWQDYLIFATDYALFISKPGSNIIQNFMSKDVLKFYCLCEYDNELYIGTSEGLYYIDATQFLEIVNQVEPVEN